MPNTVLEAMAEWAPDHREQCRRQQLRSCDSGETGLLFDLPDVDTLRSHLATLLHDPDLRKGMGARGRAIVLAEYSWRGRRTGLRGIVRAAARAACDNGYVQIGFAFHGRCGVARRRYRSAAQDGGRHPDGTGKPAGARAPDGEP